MSATALRAAPGTAGAVAATPQSVAEAAPLPDVLPPVKPRSGFLGFLRRHPTIAFGAGLLLLMLFVALFAPLLVINFRCSTRGCEAEARKATRGASPIAPPPHIGIVAGMIEVANRP